VRPEFFEQLIADQGRHRRRSRDDHDAPENRQHVNIDVQSIRGFDKAMPTIGR